MSEAATRRLLWLAALCLAPLPFAGLAPGVAPPLRLLLLGAMTGAVALGDPDRMSAIFTAIFLGQGLAWALVIYGVARLLARSLRSPRLRAVVALDVLMLLLGASLFPIYRTPFSSTGVHASVAGLLD